MGCDQGGGLFSLCLPSCPTYLGYALWSYSPNPVAETESKIDRDYRFIAEQTEEPFQSSFILEDGWRIMSQLLPISVSHRYFGRRGLWARQIFLTRKAESK